MSVVGQRPTHLDQSEHQVDVDHGGDSKESHSGHGHWMMLACCVPMLVIAVALVATGVVGAGFIVVAVGCTLMMAAMMGATSPGGRGR